MAQLRHKHRQGLAQQWCPTVLLAVLVLAVSRPGTAQVTVFPASNGANFTACVQSFLRNGGEVLCSLGPSVNMAGVPYSPPTGPFRPGNLWLNSTAGWQSPAVLDSAMRSGLTPQWTNIQAQLYWQNMVLTNLCSEWLSWNLAANFFILSSSNTFLLERARTAFTQTRTNVTMYVPYSEVLSMTYWQAMLYAPFETAQASVQLLLGSTIDTKSVIVENTMYSITATRMILPGGLDFNVTYRATNNPNDTLRLASVNNGTLMPHRLCNGPDANGTLLTAENLQRNLTIFPLWISNNDTLTRDMGEVTAALLDRPPTKPIATVMLVSNASLQPVGVSGGFVIRSDLIFQGPMNPATKVSLSLGNFVGLLYTVNVANLFMHKLVLTGLVSLPIAGGLRSALPMWGLNQVSPGGAPPARTSIQVNNVTLILPQADFAALLSAAVRGPAWKSAANTTAPIMSGITTFNPHPAYVPAPGVITKSLLLLNYTGWGMNGSNIMILPDQPLPDNYTLPDPPPPPTIESPSSGGGSSSNKGVALGVGIGCGVGITVLLAVIGYGIYVMKKRSKKAKYQDMEQANGPSKPKPVGMEATGGPGAYPARELIHKAVSQAQEAMKGSDSLNGSVPIGSTQSTRQDPTATNGHSTDELDTGLAIAMSSAAAASTRHDAETNGDGTPRGAGGACASPAATGGTSPTDGPGTGVGGSLGTPVAAADSRVTQSAPRSSDSAQKGALHPVKAVQARAGLIQKSDADKLTLLSVLGRGAWGTVYKGTWRGLTVAVKTVLFSEREDGDTTLPHERAIMEAAVCTSVAHRNVVATYHYDIKPVRMVTGGDEGLQVETDDPQALGVTDWKLFLVQEWCNSTLGQALRSWLLHKKATREPLIDLLLELLLDCAQGINYLHDKNIIHGDLKPENVMLKTDSSAQIGVVAKITDFGLSTTLAPTATHVSNYKSGTPFYVAPEVTAQGRTTKASDTYSMGVLMWEAYCCMPPWIKVGSEYQANSRFPTFPNACPAPYVRLAKSCLLADARQRPSFPQIVASLRTMLDAWQQGYDSLELPPGVAPAPPSNKGTSARVSTNVGASSSASTAAAAPAARGAAPTEVSVEEQNRLDQRATGTSGTVLSEWVRQATPNGKQEEEKSKSKGAKE